MLRTLTGVLILLLLASCLPSGGMIGREPEPAIQPTANPKASPTSEQEQKPPQRTTTPLPPPADWSSEGDWQIVTIVTPSEGERLAAMIQAREILQVAAYYTWYGMVAGSAKRLSYLIEGRRGDFRTADGRDIPKKVVDRLKYSLTGLEPSQAFMGYRSHTDDYPELKVLISFTDGSSIVLHTKSNGPGYVPWNVYAGRLWVQRNGDISMALWNLLMQIDPANWATSSLGPGSYDRDWAPPHPKPTPSETPILSPTPVRPPPPIFTPSPTPLLYQPFSTAGVPGEWMPIKGFGLRAGASVSISLDNIRVATKPETITVDGNGNFSGEFKVPLDMKLGNYILSVADVSGPRILRILTVTEPTPKTSLRQ